MDFSSVEAKVDFDVSLYNCWLKYIYEKKISNLVFLKLKLNESFREKNSHRGFWRNCCL